MKAIGEFFIDVVALALSVVAVIIWVLFFRWLFGME